MSSFIRINWTSDRPQWWHFAPSAFLGTMAGVFRCLWQRQPLAVENREAALSPQTEQISIGPVYQNMRRQCGR